MQVPNGLTLEQVEAEAKTSKITTIKAERTNRIEAIIWRRDRYRDQLEAGGSTADSAETYAVILAYIQALRDVPEQAGFPESVTWPELNI